MPDPVRFGARVNPGGPFECGFRSAKGAPVIGTKEPTLFAWSGFSTTRGYAKDPVASHKEYPNALAAALQRPRDHVIVRQSGCFVTYGVEKRAPFTPGPKELDAELVGETCSWLVGQSADELKEVDAEVAAFVDGNHDQPADAAPEDRVVARKHRTLPRE